MNRAAVYVLGFLLLGSSCAAMHAANGYFQKDPLQTVGNARNDSWRRTNRGWERAEALFRQPLPKTLPSVSGVHPLVIAGLEVLTSIAAYLVFSPRRNVEFRELTRVGSDS